MTHPATLDPRAPVVVVMGVAGSGKTTVGLVLAQRLGVTFADADSFHSDEAKALMAAGHPLTDADRAPWLERLAAWLRDEPGGCVLACSALKRHYRDVLRSGAPQLVLLHLTANPALVTDRVAHRLGHYMPASLVASQYQALEPLEPDENGVVIAASADPQTIVTEFLQAVTA